MNVYSCSICEKKTKKGTAVGDEWLCEKCVEEAEERFENAYDVAKDEGRI